MNRSTAVSLYDLALDRVIQEVKSKGSKRIVLQFPDGLIKYAVQIAGRIGEETHAETIVSLDSCYGACDLATYAASRLNADLIIHYGHASWSTEPPTPTVYVEAFASIDIVDILPKVIATLGSARKIGILSTVQHVRELPKVREFLENNGFEVMIGRATGKVHFDGQVLGCDYSVAKSISSKVEKFVLIGGGKFHAIGLALATRTESILVDPFSGEVTSTREMLRRYLKSRYPYIMEARSSSSFGVVIGLKFGQLDTHGVSIVKKELARLGKKVTLFCVDNLLPERLNIITDVDAFVTTACPRIAIDDAEHFRKPVLTPDELEIAFSDELLERYLSSD